MSYLAKAIRNLRPGAEFSFSDDDYSTVNWDVLEGKAPTQKEIDDEIVKIQNKESEDKENQAATKQAILDKLGLTTDEVAALLS
jgi:hypothetical protein